MTPAPGSRDGVKITSLRPDENVDGGGAVCAGSMSFESDQNDEVRPEADASGRNRPYLFADSFFIQEILEVPSRSCTGSL